MNIDSPPAIERRITLRLLAYWERRRAGRKMPAEHEIDPEDIRDLWGHCFVVHVEDMGKPDYQFTYLGEAVSRAFQGGLLGEQSLRLDKCCKQVVNTSNPLVDEGEYANSHGEIVKYRQCLLPLGSEAGVQAIFGGMRYKIFPAK